MKREKEFITKKFWNKYKNKIIPFIIAIFLFNQITNPEIGILINLIVAILLGVIGIYVWDYMAKKEVQKWLAQR